MPSRRISPVLLAVFAAALFLLPGAALGDAGRPVYVALGDSFAAGPLIPVQQQPWGCRKSTNNYANHLAAALDHELRDATCSGARTKHMTETQDVSPEKKFGQDGNPPQFDRLDAEVDLVTLQIGGNDIGFGDIVETCGMAALQGQSCRDTYVAGDRDTLRARITEATPKVGAAIAGVFDRAPHARVLVLGYSGIFRIGEPPDCAAMGVDERDAEYLRGVHEELNTMIAEQADLHGAQYVDVYWPSEGHTACDTPLIRWVEPFVPAHAAAPVHPNLTGMLAVADLVERAVRDHPGRGNENRSDRGRGRGRR